MCVCVIYYVLSPVKVCWLEPVPTTSPYLIFSRFHPPWVERETSYIIHLFFLLPLFLFSLSFSSPFYHTSPNSLSSIWHPSHPLPFIPPSLIKQDVQSPLFLMEVSSRVLVLAAQVNAGMWKRNGYSVARQVGAYQYHYPRGMMYDKDIVMLQVRTSQWRSLWKGTLGIKYTSL